MEHSKRAIWAASNDEIQGPRLVEISRQHAKLASLASSQLNAWEGPEEAQVTINQIKRLRAERDAIIMQFEEGDKIHEQKVEASRNRNG